MVASLAFASGIVLAGPWLSGYGAAKFVHTLVIPVIGAVLIALHVYAALIMLMARRRGAAKAIIAVQLAAIVALVLALYFALTRPVSEVPQVAALPTPSAQGDASGSERVFTVEEVARHSSPGDCWLVIGDSVYDVTSYINEHPAGPEWIIRYCGRNATEAFAKYHSARAWELLRYFYIGRVAGEMPDSSAVTTQPVGYPRGRSYGEDYDDYEEDEE